jgi:phage portal protein BeeE
MNLNPFRKKSNIPVRIVNPTLFMPVTWANQFLSIAGTVNEKLFTKYYLTVPELQSIINYRAKCKSSAKIKLRRIEGEDVIKHPILDLIRQPNFLQSTEEFIMSQSIEQDVYGNSYIYPFFGTSIDKTESLWNLPGEGVEIITDRNLNIFTTLKSENPVKEYRFNYNDSQLKFPPEQVIQFFNNLLIGTGPLTLKGQSKIQPLTQALENITTSYEARGIILGNSPMGLLSSGAKDSDGIKSLTNTEKEQVQMSMKQYGMTREKYNFLITAQPLLWQAMTTTVTDSHFKEVNEDLRTVCNAYSFPPDLLMAGTTYENTKEAKKQLYQDSIIPEMNDFLQGLSSALLLTDSGLELYADFSHIQVLQADQKARADMFKSMVESYSKAFVDGAITLPQYTEALTQIGMI